MMDKIRPILWVLVFPACWYIFAHHVTVLTMLNDPVGLVSSLFIVVVAVDFFTLPFQNKRPTDNTSETKPKQTTDPAPYRMPRTKELNDLLLVYNTRRPNGMTVTELNSLYALTAQSGEKVDETISKIHREVKYERDRRKNETPQPLGSSAEKGYAPANPNATLNRAALDTTPEKVKKAQRKAGLRCPKCDSTDVTFLNNTSKSTSAGKSLLGAEVFGLEGMVVGAVIGKKGKREYLCNHCGKRYSVRN